jgi:hypothetical protein
LYYCLNKEELTLLLDHKLHGNNLKEEHLIDLIKASQNWTYNLGALNYCFAAILEHWKKNNINCETKIVGLYNLSTQMSLEIHEMNDNLIDHMIHNLPEKNLSLEENLIELQTNVAQYEYHKSLRY